MRRPTLLYLVKLGQYETPGPKEAALGDSGNRIRRLAFKSRPRWYLVQCRARQDERALEHLERQGV